MGLRFHHAAELIGIILVLGATAVQIFYLEPLQQQIEWNKSAFVQQQNGQILAETVLDTRIALLKAGNAAPEDVEAAQQAKVELQQRYAKADANVANMVIEKEPLEDLWQMIVVALFALGTMLTTFGRVAEMRAVNRAH
ncbi:MAG: hypothetical protein AB7U75_03650 [Hyphomicrobiaceae bacterium]